MSTIHTVHLVSITGKYGPEPLRAVASATEASAIVAQFVRDHWEHVVECRGMEKGMPRIPSKPHKDDGRAVEFWFDVMMGYHHVGYQISIDTVRFPVTTTR